MHLALSSSNVFERTVEDTATVEREDCEMIMKTIELLRKSINNRSHLFQKFKSSRESIIELDESLFWSCVPLLLRNFIGMITVSEAQYDNIKRNYEFYDLIKKDLFVKSQKSLKIASISYDIINALNEKTITPKHLLFANEIFHHTRSAKLLKMTNRLGHSCSYDTILRLHQQVAEQVRLSSSQNIFFGQRKEKHEHNFLIKVADNFDHNPDGIRGDMNSIHILNQILVSTPENDEASMIIEDIVNGMVNDVASLIDGSLVRYRFLNFIRISIAFLS